MSQPLRDSDGPSSGAAELGICWCLCCCHKRTPGSRARQAPQAREQGDARAGSHSSPARGAVGQGWRSLAAKSRVSGSSWLPELALCLRLLISSQAQPQGMRPQPMPNLIPHRVLPGRCFCKVPCLLWLWEGPHLLGQEGGGCAAASRGTKAARKDSGTGAYGWNVKPQAHGKPPQALQSPGLCWVWLLAQGTSLRK